MRSLLNIFFFLLLMFQYAFIYGQSLYPVSTDEKINRSELIVEGKVISKGSYWNPQHTMIFTTNHISVYKVFKGVLTKNQIEVTTLGGTVDHYCIVASDLLSLDNNDVGVFYCNKSNNMEVSHERDRYEVYSSAQGFIQYNLSSQTASAPFVRYPSIKYNLYKELAKKVGNTPTILDKAFDVEMAGKYERAETISPSILAPVITSFTPTTVTGGTFSDPQNNVLTINGSGFGDLPDPAVAAVMFSHADKLGQFNEVPSDSTIILSWTDTQIKIRVPTQAGTGIFKVRNNNGDESSSSSQLNVLYTVLSGNFGTGIGPKQFNLMNNNGKGGYTILYSTNTANSGMDLNSNPAKATVERALNTWKELTGVNFIEGGTTNIQAVDPYDGSNVIMFDNAATTNIGPLAAGVLATCFSGANICTGGANNAAYKTGFDVVIRNSGYSTGSVAFANGPCSPYTSTTNEVDLETVLLHELGHALDHGHIIDPIESGSSLAQSNPAKLMNFSINYNVRRISLDYSAIAGAIFTITPHGYAYGNCTTANHEMVPIAKTIADYDECPSAFPTTALPSLTTVAFDLVHCTSNESSDPAYTQMTLDGSGTAITNTAFYPFRTNATGSLSLSVNNYSTLPSEIANCQAASAVAVTGVQLALYQVSSCPGGGQFPKPLYTTTFASDRLSYTIPTLTGNTDYLIVMDGVENTKATFSMVFSGTALGNPVNEKTIAVYPNPVKSQAFSIQFNNQPKGRYTCMMYNTAGQLVLRKQLTISSASQTELILSSNLCNGIYEIVILDASNHQKAALAVMIVK